MSEEATPAPSAPPRRNIGVWVAVAIGLIVIVFGAVFASRFGRDPDLVASPLIGQPAPVVTLPYLEIDGDFQFDDLAGDIVVANFWASWCTGCRVEHDALLTAASVYRDAGVSFVGILHQDRPATGLRFLEDFGRGDPYRYVHDDRSRAGIGFGVLGLPTTFFLDRSGQIVGQVNGPVSLDVLVRTIDAIIIGGTVDPITQTGELENR